MVRDLLLVALGGGMGSAARFALSLAVAERLPTAAWMGTVTVNLVGSFLMGFLFAWGRREGGPHGGLQLMLTTGALGGFTTFSTFSLDAMRAVESGRVGLAAGYVVASVGGGLLGCMAGFAAGRAA